MGPQIFQELLLSCVAILIPPQTHTKLSTNTYKDIKNKSPTLTLTPQNTEITVHIFNKGHIHNFK